MSPATRFLAALALLAATSPAAVGHAEGLVQRSSHTITDRHVVDGWFLEQTSTPAEIATRYVDAINRGDVARAVAVFSDNDIYHGGGCGTDACVGQAAIEREIRRAVAGAERMRVRSSEIAGNKLIWSGELESDAIRAAGLDYLTTMGTILTGDDVIVDYRVWPDLTDPLTALYVQQLAPAYQRVLAAPEPDTRHSLD